MSNKLRKNSLCKLKEDLFQDYSFKFKKDERLLYLGDIVNMPGHSILVRQDGTITYGFHTENFVELEEDEL